MAIRLYNTLGVLVDQDVPGRPAAPVSFASSTASQQNFMLAVSRTIQIAHILAKENDRRTGRMDLSKAPPKTRAAIAKTLGEAISLARLGFEEARSFLNRKPFTVKLTFRLWHIADTHSNESDFRQIKEDLTALGDAIEFITDEEYDRLPTATARVSGLGIPVPVIVAIIVVVAYGVYSFSPAIDKLATRALSESQAKLDACARKPGGCTPEELAALFGAPTDWAAVLRWAVIGVGVIGGLVLIGVFLPEIKGASRVASRALKARFPQEAKS